jgi:hypothetical protein
MEAVLAVCATVVFVSTVVLLMRYPSWRLMVKHGKRESKPDETAKQD